MRWFFLGATGPWVTAIALTALIYATSAALSVRRRLVILSFANLTGKDTWKGLADSIPRRLMTGISEIAEIYSQVSDDPADLTLESGKGLSPELAVDEPTAFFSPLKAAVKDRKSSLVSLASRWMRPSPRSPLCCRAPISLAACKRLPMDSLSNAPSQAADGIIRGVLQRPI